MGTAAGATVACGRGSAQQLSRPAEVLNNLLSCFYRMPYSSAHVAQRRATVSNCVYAPGFALVSLFIFVLGRFDVAGVLLLASC